MTLSQTEILFLEIFALKRLKLFIRNWWKGSFLPWLDLKPCCCGRFFFPCEENDLSWAGGKGTGEKEEREGENTARLWNGSWLIENHVKDVYVLVTFILGFWQGSVFPLRSIWRSWPWSLKTHFCLFSQQLLMSERACTLLNLSGKFSEMTWFFHHSFCKSKQKESSFGNIGYHSCLLLNICC